MIDKIRKIIEEITIEFIREFLNSPYNFTCERDIHGQFYHRILSHKAGSLLNRPFPLLHLEYPHDTVLKDNSSTLIGSSGDYNKDIKKIFAIEFEFNDTGDKAKDHFARDVNKLADCEGAYTFLFIFMRDKTFSDKKDKFKPKYFEKLIEKVEPFSPSKFPDKIYYINAQTKLMRNTIAARYNGIEVFTQDSREIEILQGKTVKLIDFL